jgi:hypothetical protein
MSSCHPTFSVSSGRRVGSPGRSRWRRSCKLRATTSIRIRCWLEPARPADRRRNRRPTIERHRRRPGCGFCAVVRSERSQLTAIAITSFSFSAAKRSVYPSLYLTLYPRAEPREQSSTPSLNCGVIENVAVQDARFLDSRRRSIRSNTIREMRGRGLMLAVELHPEAGGYDRFKSWTCDHFKSLFKPLPRTRR